MREFIKDVSLDFSLVMLFLSAYYAALIGDTDGSVIFLIAALTSFALYLGLHLTHRIKKSNS